MKKTIFLFVLLLTNLAPAQPPQSDYLVTLDGKTITCELLEYKKGLLIYKEAGQRKKIKAEIFSFSEVYFSNPGGIDNPTGLEIGTPAAGKAHIYLYRPPSTEDDDDCRVLYNDGKLVALEAGSYYLHEVMAGKKHTYLRKDLFLKQNPVEITPAYGEIYFIRAGAGNTEEEAMHAGGDGKFDVIYLLKDNPDIARYAILTMETKIMD